MGFADPGGEVGGGASGGTWGARRGVHTGFAGFRATIRQSWHVSTYKVGPVSPPSAAMLERGR